MVFASWQVGKGHEKLGFLLLPFCKNHHSPMVNLCTLPSSTLQLPEKYPKYPPTQQITWQLSCNYMMVAGPSCCQIISIWRSFVKVNLCETDHTFFCYSELRTSIFKYGTCALLWMSPLHPWEGLDVSTGYRKELGLGRLLSVVNPHMPCPQKINVGCCHNHRSLIGGSLPAVVPRSSA